VQASATKQGVTPFPGGIRHRRPRAGVSGFDAAEAIGTDDGPPRRNGRRVAATAVSRLVSGAKRVSAETLLCSNLLFRHVFAMPGESAKSQDASAGDQRE